MEWTIVEVNFFKATFVLAPFLEAHASLVVTLSVYLTICLTVTLPTLYVINFTSCHKSSQVVTSRQKLSQVITSR